MGMSPEVFDSMTVAEFVYASWGYAERVKEQTRASWELQRWATYIAVSIQLEPNDRGEMTKMFPLPWDSSVDCVEITVEERRERARKIVQG